MRESLVNSHWCFIRTTHDTVYFRGYLLKSVVSFGRNGRKKELEEERPMMHTRDFHDFYGFSIAYLLRTNGQLVRDTYRGVCDFIRLDGIDFSINYLWFSWFGLHFGSCILDGTPVRNLGNILPKIA